MIIRKLLRQVSFLHFRRACSYWLDFKTVFMNYLGAIRERWRWAPQKFFEHFVFLKLILE